MERGANPGAQILGDLQQRQYPGKGGGGGQNKQCRQTVGNTFPEDGSDILPAHGAVDENAYKQGVEHRDHCRLCRCSQPAVDGAQDDDRGQQRPKAVHKHSAQPLCPNGIHRFADLRPVLAMPETVNIGVSHQAYGNQKSGNNAANKNIPHRLAGHGGIDDHRYAGRDNDPKPACHSHQGGAEGLVIMQCHQDGDCHAPDGSYSGGGGTGQRTEKQAGDNHRTG